MKKSEPPVNFDPYNLGLLRSIVLRLGLQSRGLSDEQTLALTNLMRDVAYAIDMRLQE
jgi:hypothetical protein